MTVCLEFAKWYSKDTEHMWPKIFWSDVTETPGFAHHLANNILVQHVTTCNNVLLVLDMTVCHSTKH